MLTNLYQEYLYLIGKLKDVYQLEVDVEHKDIHTFFKEKRPLFKLFYGVFSKDSEASIVVSFQLNLTHYEAIQWFANMYSITPIIQVHDSYIEDSNGETYLGEDALAIQDMYLAQEVLEKWLNEQSQDEIKDFVESKVVGRASTPNRIFDAKTELLNAQMYFDRLRKPDDGEEIH